MRYVPRRYDPAMIEALALAGALDPELPTRGERAGDVAAATARLDQRRPRGALDGAADRRGRLSISSGCGAA